MRLLRSIPRLSCNPCNSAKCDSLVFLHFNFLSHCNCNPRLLFHCNPARLPVAESLKCGFLFFIEVFMVYSTFCTCCRANCNQQWWNGKDISILTSNPDEMIPDACCINAGTLTLEQLQGQLTCCTAARWEITFGADSDWGRHASAALTIAHSPIPIESVKDRNLKKLWTARMLHNCTLIDWSDQKTRQELNKSLNDLNAAQLLDKDTEAEDWAAWTREWSCH